MASRKELFVCLVRAYRNAPGAVVVKPISRCTSTQKKEIASVDMYVCEVSPPAVIPRLTDWIFLGGSADVT